VVKAAAGNGGSGSILVAPGSYTVSEAGANGTGLRAYTTSITCTMNAARTHPARARASGSRSGAATSRSARSRTGARSGRRPAERLAPPRAEGVRFGHGSG